MGRELKLDGKQPELQACVVTILLALTVRVLVEAPRLQQPKVACTFGNQKLLRERETERISQVLSASIGL